jgi:ABC-type polysaccharide/polyol phosphate transport system ATPase subunit
MAQIQINNLTLAFDKHISGLTIGESFAKLFRSNKLLNSQSHHIALNDINLKINNGERVGIIGHNGAGKSTLLKVISGIYPAEKGSISILGSIAPLLELGAGFHPELTGRENIYLNAAFLGHSRLRTKDMENDIIEFAELEEFIDTPVKYYSSGMYLRLAFSVATCVEPEILILDEVFAGGDSGFVKKAQERMEQLVKKSKIMILVSHDHDLIKRLTTRIITMESGSIVNDKKNSK